MTGWRQQVDDLLYDAETVQETVEFDAGTVVATSHRVLVFTPEGDGANFQQVDRPNVEGVKAGARGNGNLLAQGLKVGLVGAVLVVAGQVIDLDGLLGDVAIDSEASSSLGVGGILRTIQDVLNLLAQLDELLQLAGALAVLLAVGLVGAYWYTRERTVVVEVAGGEDIHVPTRADVTEGIARLQRTLAPETGDGGNVTPDGSGDPLRES